MSSYPLTEPPLETEPRQRFLPIGLSIAAAMVLCLSLLLWYGCGWMVTSDAMWRHVGAGMNSDSSNTLAVNDRGNTQSP